MVLVIFNNSEIIIFTIDYCMERKIILIFPRWRQRTVLNEFIRNTEVSRVDKPNEFFQFTENFHGNAPLQVLNIQNVPVASPRSLPRGADEPGVADVTEPQYVKVGIHSEPTTESYF